MLRYCLAVLTAACLLTSTSMSLAIDAQTGDGQARNERESKADAPAADSQEAADGEAAADGPHDWLLKHATIQNLLKLHNAERARNGLPELKLNPQMCLAAQKHAVWMASTGVYTHSGLPWPEIIFQGPRSAREAVQGWIYSPAHHGIMLSGRECGFGYMVIDGRTYWVGVFK